MRVRAIPPLHVWVHRVIISIIIGPNLSCICSSIVLLLRIVCSAAELPIPSIVPITIIILFLHIMHTEYVSAAIVSVCLLDIIVRNEFHSFYFNVS